MAGEGDQRDVAERPDRREDVEPVGVGQVEVEQDKVGLALVKGAQPIVASFGTYQLSTGCIRQPS